MSAGEFIAIMGPFGSGKSTLLNMIGGLDRPTSGEVVVDGVKVSTVGDLAEFRAQKVGFVFQLHNLIPSLTALENVMIPMFESALTKREKRAKAQKLLEAVGLGDRIHFLPTKLSGGERQRVAIARSLANDPKIILADEPTGNLDTTSGLEIIALLKSLNQMGKSVVLVTHDQEMAGQAQTIYHMKDGKILETIHNH